MIFLWHGYGLGLGLGLGHGLGLGLGLELELKLGHGCAGVVAADAVIGCRPAGWRAPDAGRLRHRPPGFPASSPPLPTELHESKRHIALVFAQRVAGQR